MKKKILVGSVIAMVLGLVFIGGLCGNTEQALATPEQGLGRTAILGWDAVPGEVYFEFQRAEINTEQKRNVEGAVLAKYVFKNTGWNDMEINNPSFYAMSESKFLLSDSIENIRLYNPSEPAYLPAKVVHNTINIPVTIKIPAYETMETVIVGDIKADAKVGLIEFEPNFSSSSFVINYADKLGNDLGLAPFNMTGQVQTVRFGSGGLTNSSTADNASFARYYERVIGTLSSPYIPEGAIMRDEAGIDVYIVKYNKSKRFKRLILSPSVFNSYGHLKWENILIVNDAVMDSYSDSSFAFVAGDPTIWRLEPSGDTGTKRKFLASAYDNPLWKYDPDGVYEINAVDRDSYIKGRDIISDGLVTDKPVIYLYPTEVQDVKVSLDFDGQIYSTYPAYENGWNVTAYPDGRLINSKDKKEYSYLFWDGISDPGTSYDLSTGFVVRGEDTGRFLQEKLSQFGLTPKEYNEFIVYWMPQMQENKYNLIHFASKEEYDDHARLTITPEPDAVLRVFMAYEPLTAWQKVEAQEIKPFVRQGFTVVEWGGTEVK